jgi:hypothetical protein
MFFQIGGQYINLLLVREVSFNGTHTILDLGGPAQTFDTLRFEGDYRDAILKATGGSVLTARVTS